MTMVDYSIFANVLVLKARRFVNNIPDENISLEDGTCTPDLFLTTTNCVQTSSDSAPSLKHPPLVHVIFPYGGLNRLRTDFLVH